MIEHGVSVPQFKGEVKNALEKQSKKSESEALKKAESRKSSIKNSGSPKKNTDDDDEDEPFGKYDDALYHHQNSKGVKSPAPDNGQEALNNSIGSPNPCSKRRYGISSTGQFIVFSQTRPKLYHGHVVTWDDLGAIKGLQREMVSRGLATKSGRAILRIIKKVVKKVIR